MRPENRLGMRTGRGRQERGAIESFFCVEGAKAAPALIWISGCLLQNLGRSSVGEGSQGGDGGDVGTGGLPAGLLCGGWGPLETIKEKNTNTRHKTKTRVTQLKE